MKTFTRALAVLSFVLIVGCSSGEDDHVWQDQVDALEKAKQVEKKVQDTFEQQRQVLEEQSQ